MTIISGVYQRDFIKYGDAVKRRRRCTLRRRWGVAFGAASHSASDVLILIARAL